MLGENRPLTLPSPCPQLLGPFQLMIRLMLTTGTAPTYLEWAPTSAIQTGRAWGLGQGTRATSRPSFGFCAGCCPCRPESHAAARSGCSPESKLLQDLMGALDKQLGHDSTSSCSNSSIRKGGMLCYF